MSGLSLEALNDIGQRRTRMIIVLNDNEMSISPTVGAVSQYLSRIKLSRRWRGSRRAYDDIVARVPRGRAVAARVVAPPPRTRSSTSRSPGSSSRTSAITYVGPGARPRPRRARLDAPQGASSRTERPILVHVRTRKGLRLSARRGRQGRLPRRGPAAHGGARSSTATARTTSVASDGDAAPSAAQRAAPARRPATRQVMVGELIEIGRERRPGRRDHRRHAHRHRLATLRRGASPGALYDVGIAEQHAMTLATGLALARPAPLRGAVLDVPPARLRPGRPRRLPERRAGRHRHRPCRARRRGRHQPPGHVHARRAAPAAQPRHGRAARRAAAAAAPAHRLRPGASVRDAVPARPRLGPAARRARSPSRSAAARCWRRGARSSSSGSGPSSSAAARPPSGCAATAGRSALMDARFARPLDVDLHRSRRRMASASS